MTTARPDRPLTAADLLFGSSADAPEALARQIVSACRGQNLGRALERLPRVTRDAAIREAALAAAVLLKIDLVDVLVAGWRDHRDIHSAARRTLATPGSKELVGVAPHRISTVQQPAVSILLDGHRVHTLQLGLSIIFEVTGLVAGVSRGRLAGLHAGRGEVGVALTVHEIEILTKRAHLELPGMVALRTGLRLLPGHEYPDDAAGGHPSSELAWRSGLRCGAPGQPVPGRRPHGRPVRGHRGPRQRAFERPAPSAPGIRAAVRRTMLRCPGGRRPSWTRPAVRFHDRGQSGRITPKNWPRSWCILRRPIARARVARISKWISGANGEPACRRPAKALESKIRFRGHRPGLSTGGSRWWQHRV